MENNNGSPLAGTAIDAVTFGWMKTPRNFFHEQFV